MKYTISAVLMFGCVVLLTTGCPRKTAAPARAPAPAAVVPEAEQQDEGMDIVIEEDQSILLNGKTVTVDELVTALELVATNKIINLAVASTSKAKPETIRTIIAELRKRGYDSMAVSADAVSQPKAAAAGH